VPAKPQRPCKKPGCPSLTRDKSGYCEEHKRQEARSYEQRRGSPIQRGYGYRWQKARLSFLRRHPVCECEDCKKNKRILPATVVDHVIPHKGNYFLFWDKNNWQAMAKSCHDRKTAKEDGGFGKKVKTPTPKNKDYRG
jgi:5-methylcytosine-specific restriction protein A